MRPHARVAGTLAIIAVVLAAATIAQEPGCSQTSHLALVKAIGDGTVRIDRYATETCDESYSGGHFYSNKAPGLALFELPWYAALAAVDLGPATTAQLGWPRAMTEMPRSSLWRMTVWGAGLVALALLLLVRRVADELVPGYGGIGAVTLGLATLVLPFSTLLFSHLLSAALGLAAFAVLLAERRRPSATKAAAAGALAGLAVVSEYPLAIVAVVLAGYLAASRPRAERLGAYCAGCLAGLTPLLLYDVIAFGSPFRLSYADAVNPGETAIDIVAGHNRGFYGVALPSLRSAAELLAAGKGLLTLTPVVAAGVAGLFVLARRGRRAEAITCGAVCLLFLVYNASYFGGFGGWVPGPRYLVPALPFLAVGVAAAYAARPTVVLALAVPSLGFMTAATLTRPQIEQHTPQPWLHDLLHGELTESVLTFAGNVTGWPAVAPFILLATVAVAAGIVSMPRPRFRRDEIPPALGALLLWLVVASSGDNLLGTDAVAGGWFGLAATTLLIGAIVVAVLLYPTRGWKVAVAALPLLLLAAPGFAGHTAASALVALLTLALLTGAAVTSRQTAPA